MKHLVFDNAVIAKQRGEEAFARKRPNWRAVQLDLYENHQDDHPNVRYKHPDTIHKLNLFEQGRVAKNGNIEVDIDDDDVQWLEESDQGKVTTTKLIEDEQGER